MGIPLPLKLMSAKSSDSIHGRQYQWQWLTSTVMEEPVVYTEPRHVKLAGGLPHLSKSGLQRMVTSTQGFSGPLSQVKDARLGPLAFQVQQQTEKVCLQIQESSILRSVWSDSPVGSGQPDQPPSSSETPSPPILQDQYGGHLLILLRLNWPRRM